MGLIKSILAGFMAITGGIGIGAIFSTKMAEGLAKYTSYGSTEFMALALAAIIVYIMLE